MMTAVRIVMLGSLSADLGLRTRPSTRCTLCTEFDIAALRGCLSNANQHDVATTRLKHQRLARRYID